MPTYTVEVPGKFSLEDISNAIGDEEILLARFRSSTLWTNASNELSNLVEFEVLGQNPDPALGRPIFSMTAPSGARTLAWSGPMVVAGIAGTVYMSRNTAVA